MERFPDRCYSVFVGKTCKRYVKMGPLFVCFFYVIYMNIDTTDWVYGMAANKGLNARSPGEFLCLYNSDNWSARTENEAL